MHINRYTQPQTLTISIISNPNCHTLPNSLHNPRLTILSEARESATTQQPEQGSGDMARHVEINEAGKQRVFQVAFWQRWLVTGFSFLLFLLK